MKVSPCKDCTTEIKQKHNHPYCHSNCEDYISWRDEVRDLNVHIRKEYARYPVELIKRNENTKIKRRQRNLY